MPLQSSSGSDSGWVCPGFPGSTFIASTPPGTTEPSSSGGKLAYVPLLPNSTCTIPCISSSPWGDPLFLLVSSTTSHMMTATLTARQDNSTDSYSCFRTIEIDDDLLLAPSDDVFGV